MKVIMNNFYKQLSRLVLCVSITMAVPLHTTEGDSQPWYNNKNSTIGAGVVFLLGVVAYTYAVYKDKIASPALLWKNLFSSSPEILKQELIEMPEKKNEEEKFENTNNKIEDSNQSAEKQNVQNVHDLSTPDNKIDDEIQNADTEFIDHLLSQAGSDLNKENIQKDSDAITLNDINKEDVSVLEEGIRKHKMSFSAFAAELKKALKEWSEGEMLTE